MKSRSILCLGTLIMALGVGLGAFGAHALRAMVDASALATWHTAVLYQLLHGLGLGVGAWMHRARTGLWRGVAALIGASGLLMLAARV